MWPRIGTQVVWLVVVLLCLRSGIMAEEEPNNNLCAMKEAMVAMKDLLSLLTDEVRELRKQVGQSCAPADQDTSKKPDDTTEDPTDDTDDTDKSAEKDDGPSEPSAGTSGTTATPTTTTEEYDYEDTNFTNPIDNVVSGFGDWWTGFSLFDAQTTTEEPETPDDEDKDDEYYDTTVPIDDDDDDDEYVQPVRPQPPPPQPPRRTTTTTTTTTQPPYGLPPVPTSCPEPFRLLAETCILILDSQHTWSTWGEAYALCERYGGELAAPWRFDSMREFLSQYYTSPFWVGARRMSHSRRWEWLSGRPVQPDEWWYGRASTNAGQNCMRLDKRTEYKAVSHYCGEKFGFVCESREH